MPFGYSRKIFKYPAVQYIPLDRYNEVIAHSNRISGRAQVYVYSYLENDELKRRLNYLGHNDTYNINKGQLAILVRGAEVDLVQYRGYEVTMVGNVNPGTYQVFKVTTAYFYKDKIIFTLYDGESSERLDLAQVRELVKNL